MCIRKINIDDFSSDFISMIYKTQINALNLNTKLKQLLNQHALLKTNYLTLHNETIWYNSKIKNVFKFYIDNLVDFLRNHHQS